MTYNVLSGTLSFYTTTTNGRLCSEHVGLTTGRFAASGGASAGKEPGHFEVRKSSSQVTRMHFFPQKTLMTFCYGNIFIFHSHYYPSKAIRRARQGGARAVDLPARSFDLAQPAGAAPPLFAADLARILS